MSLKPRRSVAYLLQEQRRLQLLISFHRRSLLTQGLEETLVLLAKEVRQLLEAQRVVIYFIDAGRSELLAKTISCRQPSVALPPVPMSDGVAGFVARTGKTVLTQKAERHPSYDSRCDQPGPLLACPIRGASGRPIGVIEVNKRPGAPPFVREDAGLMALVSSKLAATMDNAQLLEQLKRSNLESIYILAQAAEYRDQEDTAHHLKRMSEFSAVIAQTMGLALERVEIIRFASPLHDIGKIAIRDAVLKKPGRFSPQEYEEMKRHTLLGYEMLREAQSPMLQLAREIALTHHERFDGGGYPRGLKGLEIPLESRIVSLADVFDALSTERIYKPPWPLERVREHIRGEAGKHFDPQVVEAFEASLSRFERIITNGKAGKS